MIMFFVAILAISILLYVLLDGFDLGVGILFGAAREEAARRSMMGAVAPVWDGNETWLVVSGVVLWGAFPLAYSILLSAFYLPLLLMLAGLILRGVAFEYRCADGAAALDLGLKLRRRLARRDLHAGSDGRRAGRGPAALRRALRRRHVRLGQSVRGAYAESASVSATRCSAPAGLSGNAKAKSARRPIAGSPTSRLRCSSS